MWSLLNWIRKLRQKFHSPGFLSYGILKPCRHCHYGKHYEPILIYSFNRGVRCIVNYNSETYIRRGECPNFNNCMKCLDAIDNPKKYSCTWIKI